MGQSGSKWFTENTSFHIYNNGFTCNFSPSLYLGLRFSKRGLK